VYRCLGQGRRAVDAYQEAIERGDSDPVLPLLIDSISSGLAELSVLVTGANWRQPPRFTVTGSREFELNADVVDRSGVRFLGLPPDETLTLKVGGLGYAPGEVEVAPIPIGEEAEIELEAVWQGMAQIDLPPWRANVTVNVVDASDRYDAIEAGTLKLTAGEVVVEVVGDTGTAIERLDLQDGARLKVDVATLLPAQVTLVGVPGGSNLQITGGPDQEDRAPIDVTREKGALNEEVGIPMSPVPLLGLRSGQYSAQIEHPALGEMGVTFFAVGGEVSAQPVSWQNMPGFASTRSAYRVWRAQEEAASKLGPHAVRSLSGAGGSGLFFGLATGFMVNTVKHLMDAKELTESYDASLADGDAATAQELFIERMGVQRSVQAGWVRTSIAGGLMMGAGVFALIEWKLDKDERVDVPPWNPYGEDEEDGLELADEELKTEPLSQSQDGGKE